MTRDRRTVGRATKKTYVESTNYNNRHRAYIDTRADTVCGGKGWRIYELTEKVCDVGAYHESLPSMRDVPVATIVTALITQMDAL
jgi:hypothetical protein